MDVLILLSVASCRTRVASRNQRRTSLLERRPGGRYVMHDLVRDYAAITAHDLPAGLREAALTRVMDFHLHTADAAQHLLDPHVALLHLEPPSTGVHPHPLADAAAAMAWLETEQATLLATQRAAVALGRHHLVWHLAYNLETFHHWRGYWRDSLAMWRTALDAAVHVPDPTARITALGNLGYACSRLGLNEEAATHLHQALALAVDHADLVQQARTHKLLAAAWERRRDNRRAMEHARHALNLYRTLAHPVSEADTLNVMGWCAAHLGEYDTAWDHCRAALALQRRHGSLDGAAATLDCLGFIAHRVGDHHLALEHYQESLNLRRALGSTYLLAGTLDDVGHPHVALGQPDRACAVWREALELYQEQGRSADAERVTRQLDDLDNPGDAAGSHK